jgi:hypothetical protein
MPAPASQSVLHSNLPLWPADLPLMQLFINDASWPANLRLDLDSSNWDEWSLCMELVAQCQGFNLWLEGTFTQPELSIDANKHYLWQSNDKSLRGFMLNTISHSECKIVHLLKTANAIWNALHTWHEK